ncbi:MAG TPA: ATP-binding cassette domain-containing protein [Candidatus Hydrogenedentes bacterium]|jgi:ABC-type Fe3+/spermidine/putrescine transport system ATPase subunit|nr:ATP-binding cassette domain-containing protein [Candidatus Hydrogenedentota bacterium]HPJ98576.1 ATP-binding cassette domain-containing protein [Candidatus Hydrogenedentota bacterium]
MPTVKFDSVTKVYRGTPVFQGISATLAPNEGLCLSGPAASGKSTLLRLVAGLELPSAGSVTVDDVPAAAGELHTRAIGMVFQELALWPHMSVEKHLLFVLHAQEISREKRIERVEHMLALSGLAGKRRERPGSLSLPHQQRLALARALIVNPRLLLLDEPFTYLERAAVQQFTEEILRRRSAEHLTVIIATQGCREAWPLVDRLLMLNEGRCHYGAIQPPL